MGVGKWKADRAEKKNYVDIEAYSKNREEEAAEREDQAENLKRYKYACLQLTAYYPKCNFNSAQDSVGRDRNL